MIARSGRQRPATTCLLLDGRPLEGWPVVFGGMRGPVLLDVSDNVVQPLSSVVVDTLNGGAVPTETRSFG